MTLRAKKPGDFFGARVDFRRPAGRCNLQEDHTGDPWVQGVPHGIRRNGLETHSGRSQRAISGRVDPPRTRCACALPRKGLTYPYLCAKDFAC